MSSILDSISAPRLRAAAIGAGAALALGIAAVPAGAADLNIIGGSASGGPIPNGSYLQLTAGGTPITNTDSQNTLDQTYTWLTPGNDGGLDLGSFQGTGDILSWKTFAGYDFTSYTTNADPAGIKTGTFPAPTLTFAGGTLTSGDLRSWTISYSPAAFLYNQGARTGLGGVDNDLTGTSSTSGSTTNYTLSWSSQINAAYPGDPFGGAVGNWRIRATN